MRLAILNDPNNFHTKKWATALKNHGVEVTVISFEEGSIDGVEVVRIPPRFRLGKKYSYFSFLFGGKELEKELVKRNIELVNALNITPYGVWATKSNHPNIILSAFGADILEYPPGISALFKRTLYNWGNPNENPSLIRRGILFLKNLFFRKMVEQSLQKSILVFGDNEHLVHKIKNWFKIPADKVKKLYWGIENPSKIHPDIQGIEEKYNITPDQILLLVPRGAKAIYNTELILEGIKEPLKSYGKKLRVIVLGAGYEISKKVETQSQRLELEHNNFTLERGLLTPTEMIALWARTDFFINAPKYDGYSASLAEGRYYGGIPIVNNIEANKELLKDGETAFFVEPFTSEKLGKELVKILKIDKELKEKIRSVNKKWITENSLIEKNALEFIEQCRLVDL